MSATACDNLAHLEQGATCLSANRRLRIHLQDAFAKRMQAQGRFTWPSPDIVPWDAWLERKWRENESAADGAGAPLLLNDAQELALWEKIIAAEGEDKSPLWRKSETAQEARAAHRAMAEWRLDEQCLQDGNADVRAFAGWREKFLRHCADKNWIDRVAMHRALLAREPLRVPGGLTVAGFDYTPPLLEKFLARCRKNGTNVVEIDFPKIKSEAHLYQAADPQEELHRAASWCRALVEKNGADITIGVVVRDLESRRESARRIFTDVLGGFDSHMDELGAERLFHLSLGAPLAAQPLAAAALDLLEWTCAECDFETFSRWLRSPFIKDAEPELAARARVDFKLRQSLPSTLNKSQLCEAVANKNFMDKNFGDNAPSLRRMLEQLCSEEQKEKLSLSEWARKFSARLACVNWPGGGLNSHQHQTVQSWYDMLDDFASLSLVNAACDERVAFSQLRRMAAARPFNLKAGAAPVQVMRLEESAGLEFDALWAAGFSDAVWPAPPMPLAFLPTRAQRKAGMPRGDWDASLRNAKNLTARLITAAPTVVFSYAQLDDEREMRPSELLKRDDISVGYAPQKIAPPLGEARACLETVDDAHGLPLSLETPAAGGASLFQDQSQCPFRAYVRHRLDGKDFPQTRAAPNAMDRGTLVHGAMRRLWSHWRDRDALCAESDDALKLKVDAAVRKTLENFRRDNLFVLGAAARQLLAEQLCALILRHLEFEKQRPPFTIVALEEKYEKDFYQVKLRVRMDRVDRLQDGSLLVMDYKTGDAKPSSWKGERPQEPQLPLYRALLGDTVQAIAFARIRSGETDDTRFVGECGVECGLKVVDWDATTAEWDANLKQLATDITAGKATVDPVKGEATCRYCNLRGVCRVDEKDMHDDNGDEHD